MFFLHMRRVRTPVNRCVKSQHWLFVRSKERYVLSYSIPAKPKVENRRNGESVHKKLGGQWQRSEPPLLLGAPHSYRNASGQWLGRGRRGGGAPPLSADFRAEFGDKPEAERLRLSASRASDSSRKILVVFCEDFQNRKQHMVGILSQIVNKEMLDKVILILQSKLNYHAQKVLDDYPVKSETFPITGLLVNVTKHYLHPKYEILTSEEKNQLLEKYNVQANQLPKMQENDAIARYYGLEKGQVIRVSYSGDLTDYMKNHRCVV